LTEKIRFFRPCQEKRKRHFLFAFSQYAFDFVFSMFFLCEKNKEMIFSLFDAP